MTGSTTGVFYGLPPKDSDDPVQQKFEYLIMIPIALGVYFLFLGGYEYLADLADLSQREGFFAVFKHKIWKAFKFSFSTMTPVHNIMLY